jgi:PAS domain S-box-containing protein
MDLACAACGGLSDFADRYCRACGTALHTAVDERSSPMLGASHILQSVPHSVIVTALDGTISYWNRGAEALFGWSAREVLGQNILTLTPSEAVVESAADIMAQLRAGAIWSGEFALRRRDGTPFDAWVTDAPIAGPDGTLLGIVGITLDLPDRGRAPFASQEAAARLPGMHLAIRPVAHELNRRLQLVLNAVEAVDAQALQMPRLRPLLRQALEALEDTTQHPRALAPHRPAPPVPHREAMLPDLTEPLSVREMEVLALLARRFSNKEIAESLCVSWQTVAKHTNNIYQKLRVTGRRDAVERAEALGIRLSAPDPPVGA